MKEHVSKGKAAYNQIKKYHDITISQPEQTAQPTWDETNYTMHTTCAGRHRSHLCNPSLLKWYYDFEQNEYILGFHPYNAYSQHNYQQPQHGYSQSSDDYSQKETRAPDPQPTREPDVTIDSRPPGLFTKDWIPNETEWKAMTMDGTNELFNAWKTSNSGNDSMNDERLDQTLRAQSSNSRYVDMDSTQEELKRMAAYEYKMRKVPPYQTRSDDAFDPSKTVRLSVTEITTGMMNQEIPNIQIDYKNNRMFLPNGT